MKHSYDDKFKERDPLQTVEFIENFFNKKGFTTNLVSIHQTESKTWSSQLELWFNSHLILTSYGKGITQNYCLASAYGELYERFCNRIFYIWNPFISKDVIQNCKNQNNYYFSPQEKIITYEEVVTPFSHIFSYLENNNELKSFFSMICENQFIGVPYQSIINEQQLFLDPRMLIRAWGSTGMAAGNTFEEAFNQGFSEVLEHHVQGFYSFNKCDVYHEIDLTLLKNSKLQTIIKNIQKMNNEIHVIDFSYNTGCPVLMVILVNKCTNVISITLGAFPVFDIALERILTELYQGKHSFSEIKLNGQKPFLSEKISNLNINPGGSLIGHTEFPEFILLNSKLSEPNPKVFLFGSEYSNIEIFNYYKNFCITNNYNIYWSNTSQDNNIIALQLYSPDIDTFQNHKICTEIKDKSQVYLFIIQYYHFLSEIISGKYPDFKLLNKLLLMYLEFTDIERYLLYHLLSNQWDVLYPPYGHTNSWNIYLYCLYDKDNLSANYKAYAEFYYGNYSQINKYLLLHRYKQCNKYSDDEIIKILSFLGLTFSLQDFEKYLDSEYLLNTIVFTPFYQIHLSDEYNSYISSLNGQ